MRAAFASLLRKEVAALVCHSCSRTFPHAAVRSGSVACCDAYSSRAFVHHQALRGADLMIMTEQVRVSSQEMLRRNRCSESLRHFVSFREKRWRQGMFPLGASSILWKLYLLPHLVTKATSPYLCQNFGYQGKPLAASLGPLCERKCGSRKKTFGA